MWVRPGAYPKLEHQEVASLGKSPALPTNIRLDWRGLAGTNTLAYYEKSVNYGSKRFYSIGLRIQRIYYLYNTIFLTNKDILKNTQNRFYFLQPSLSLGASGRIQTLDLEF